MHFLIRSALAVATCCLVAISGNSNNYLHAQKLKTVPGPKIKAKLFQRMERQPGVFYVGVRHQPELLSPATAFVDSERQALELLFQSLIRQINDPQSGIRYEHVLARRLPRPEVLGRTFELDRTAKWYLGRDKNEPVTDADVVGTMTKYRQWAGAGPAWRSMMKRPVNKQQYRIRIPLYQGCMDPLSLMTFKVLPAGRLDGADDLAFARNPIGSGPYRFAGRMQPEDQPAYVSFQANHAKPPIQEIRFYSLWDIQNNLGNIPIDLLIDPPTMNLQTLKDLGKQGIRVAIHTVPNRRIWFLAVNLRRPELRDSTDLRRAVALSIDRELLLDQCFRAAKSEHHRVLSGPYPPDSWAADPSPLRRPFDPKLAKNHAKKLPKGIKLTLKYPDDLDPYLSDACSLLAQQVANTSGIQIELEPMPWRKVHEAVAREHNYELAYYCWEYPNDYYPLWPMFDPSCNAPGGPNFLGPVQDASLQKLFQQLQDHRQFSKVQELTKQIHRRIFEKMYFIPLWQLDTHLVVRKEWEMAPEPGRIDPHKVFADVVKWKLESTGKR